MQVFEKLYDLPFSAEEMNDPDIQALVRHDKMRKRRKQRNATYNMLVYYSEQNNQGKTSHESP